MVGIEMLDLLIEFNQLFKCFIYLNLGLLVHWLGCRRVFDLYLIQLDLQDRLLMWHGDGSIKSSF